MTRIILTGALALIINFGATESWAEDKIGVPACDDFLAKYETCLSSKIPAAQQMAFKAQLDQTRKGWSELAKDESMKPTLEATCKQTVEHVKTALQSFGCSF